MKNLRYAIQKKYKNQAAMNLTPLSQNSHAVRWHCTAESKRKVAYFLFFIVVIIIIKYAPISVTLNI